MQWAEYLRTQKRRSIFLSVVCSSEKQAEWLRKCLCKYSIEFPSLVWEMLEKLKVVASVIPGTCVTPLEIWLFC